MDSTTTQHDDGSRRDLLPRTPSRRRALGALAAAAALGPFDVAFLPINAARQESGRFRDVGIGGTMSAREAVAATRALEARSIVPIHYGRATASDDYREDPGALDALRREAATAGTPLHVLAEGESLTL